MSDMNADGQLTNADLQGMINYLANGGNSGGSSLTAVPEPASFVLLGIGAALTVAIGRTLRRACPRSANHAAAFEHRLMCKAPAGASTPLNRRTFSARLAVGW